MTTTEKEMVVMGEIMANTRTGEITIPNKKISELMTTLSTIMGE